MKGLSRRDLVRSTSAGAVGLATGAIGLSTPAIAQPAEYNADAVAAQISNRLFAEDGLAHPAPTTPAVSDLAKGLDRTLVLGGGGEYYVAWYAASFTVSTIRTSI